MNKKIKNSTHKDIMVENIELLQVRKLDLLSRFPCDNEAEVWEQILQIVTLQQSLRKDVF